MITCKNCSEKFEGNFCPNCAQSAKTHRFTLPHLFEEIVHAATHVERGILFLLRQLFFKPGIVAKEYVAGKRRKYFNPITLLLLLIAFQAFTIQKTGIMDAYIAQLQTVTVNFMRQIEQGQEFSKEEQNFRKQMEKTNEQVKTINENNRTAHMVMLPLLSALTWLFFRKSGYNYTENLVMNVITMSGVQIYSFLTWILPFLIYPDGVLLFMMLNFVVMIAYNILTYKQFYGQSWGRSILKGFLIQVIYVLIIGMSGQILSRF